MSENELPDWIREGATVAEYDYGRGYYASATVTTVAKLTDTQIVLANGNRYRRDKVAIGGGPRPVGDRYTRLCPLDDPSVVSALASNALRALGPKVDRVIRDAGRDVENVLAALDDIERIVKAARAAIQSPGTKNDEE